MRVVLLVCFVLAAGFATSASAADCKSRIAEMSPRAQTIKETRTRELFEFDMKRAAKELNEGDEDECAEALDHATTLLEPK